MRHGETAWNREGRLQGGREAALNALGQAQAGDAGDALRGLLAERGLAPAALAFLCSPLGRARDTMEILRGRLGPGLPAVLVEARLREIGFGEWEGRTWEDLRRAEPALMAERRRDAWNFVPPGGESYAGLAARLRPWLDAAPEDAVVVAHGGVARALLSVRGELPPERAVAAEIHQGRVLVFEGAGARWA